MVLLVVAFDLTLEAIAKKRAEDRDGRLYEFLSGDGMLRVPPVESTKE